MDVCGPAAAVLENWGKAAEAQAAAETGLQVSRMSTARWECHLVLGKLAASRGDPAAAEAALEAAIEEARQCYLPGLELRALAFLEALVLGPAGRQQEAEDRIKALAREKLQKPLEELRPLLLLLDAQTKAA